MNSTSQSNQDAIQTSTLPDSPVSGSTILVTGDVDPTTYAAVLRALSHYGDSTESALVVTTRKSADQSTNELDIISEEEHRPVTGFVDMTSEHQYVTDLYGKSPTVHIPSPADLEKLVIGLSDLAQDSSLRSDTRHLVVRSLTPMIERTSIEQVSAVLERIVGLRTETGLSLIGIDSTAHDEETIDELLQQVDGVLWVVRTPNDQIEFELRTTNSHQSSVIGSDSGDD